MATLSFVSVAGYSQARVTVEAHTETSWVPGCCPQHCYRFRWRRWAGSTPSSQKPLAGPRPRADLMFPWLGPAQLPRAIWVARASTEEQGDNKTQSFLRPSVRWQRGLCMCVLAAWSQALGNAATMTGWARRAPPDARWVLHPPLLLAPSQCNNLSLNKLAIIGNPLHWTLRSMTNVTHFLAQFLLCDYPAKRVP